MLKEGYQELIEQAPILIWRAGTDGLCNYFNERWLSYRGRTLDQEFGNGWTEGVHPDDFDHCLEIYQTNFDLRRPFEMEYRLMRYDGKYRWILDCGSPYHTPSGDFKGYIGSCIDVTERWEAEDELQRTFLKLKQALSAGNLGFWERDLHTGTIAFSAECIELLGIECDSVTQNEDIWMDRCHPDDLQLMEGIWKSGVDAARLERQAEFRMRHNDGSYRWILGRLSLVNDREGQPDRIVGVHMDITEHKTIELYELEAAQSEVLSELAGGVGHDFNNLLCVIAGNISLAEISTDEDEIKKCYDTIQQTIRLGSDLSQQLMDLARGESVKTSIVRLDTLIERSCKLLLSNSLVNYTFDAEPNLWPVKVDKTQMHQVFGNLVINAEQAIDGQGHISVYVKNIVLANNQVLHLNAGNYVLVTVRDNGPGIPPEVLPHLFIPFYTSKEDGNGLGLPTTQKLINQHGGSITVQSTVGNGSEFSVYLPAVPIGMPSESDHTKVWRLLVMDDDEFILDVLESMLARFGYESSFSKDPETALKMFDDSKKAGQEYDAVLLDLNTAYGKGGLYVKEHIRKVAPDIPIVLTSGSIADPAFIAYKENGFDAVIGKPFLMTEMKDLLRSILADN